MENEKDRRMTILLVPFMSCSAKLPVYGLISAAFFGPWAGLVVFGLYITGMLVGIASGLFFKKTLFAGEPAPFVLELSMGMKALPLSPNRRRARSMMKAARDI